MVVTKAQVIAWIENTAKVIQANKEYLTQLDSPIGDADHGINMSRGFGKVVEKLPSVVDTDIGTILKTIGMTLMSTVGGASGPLYGTFFMRAGTSAAAKQELSGDDLFNLLQAGVDGVVQRGRAQLQDKTMYDAWVPALATLRADLDQGKTIVEAMNATVAAAERGRNNTIPLQARKGRASYLGERSIGHQDPGATSTHLILKALLDVLQE
ncbi:MAG: dihydroxyacetone kinase ADP-binding subunit DhaL [Chloroflexi bacterium]|nr:dihydroxyacetone kinase ADP-binding subunit DhaL [Chloroflexota bacterium]MBP8058811.1 dihydroxyacetone kinase ADP-binding subunit DhaL [Chloroflexota bacterium]